MKRAWLVPVLALALSACDMRSPAQKKKEAEEAARKSASPGQIVRPDPPEEGHVLVKGGEGQESPVQRPAVAMVKVTRDGVITVTKLNFEAGVLRKTEMIGASSTSGCCSSGDPADMRSMGGAFHLLRGTGAGDAESCDEPVVVDGDYKAPWFRVRAVLETMSRAKMSRLVFATSTKSDSLKGVIAKLPPGWDATAPLLTETKRIDVGASGKELDIRFDGTTYNDVASAAAALQKAGVKEIGIHPADRKTPLWAVVKGVELANVIAPAGPVRFVMVDQ